MRDYDQIREHVGDEFFRVLFDVHREWCREIDVADFVEEMTEAAAACVVSSFMLACGREKWTHEELIERIERTTDCFARMLQKAMKTEMIKDENDV
jgi:hypothetical protein